MRFAAIVGTLTLIGAAACGARTDLAHLDASVPSSDAGVPSRDAGRDARVDAGPPVAFQCLCPEEPGYAACALPEMCCPCLASCENPATFLCTCSEPRSCAAVPPPDAGRPPVGCAAAGGVCVLGRWANCPPGRQPTEDLHADCVAVVSRGDFCCVPAPPSTASLAEAMIDCFPTRDCERCWEPTDDPAFTCAGGRVACSYVCLD